MNMEEINPKIEQYLLGHMKEAEAAAFQKEIETNPELAAEVRQYEIEHAAMNEMVSKELGGFMQEWDQEVLQEQVQNGKIRKRARWLLGLIAVLIISLIILLITKPWQRGPENVLDPDIPIAQVEQIRAPLSAVDPEGLGVTGGQDATDSLTILFPKDPQYDFHYRFKESTALELFISLDKEDLEGLRLEYVVTDNEDVYYLYFNDSRYKLIQGFNAVYELKAEE